ncbi:hypothetical protein ACMFMF_005005 [Clarireedia jacksonii]
MGKKIFAENWGEIPSKAGPRSTGCLSLESIMNYLRLLEECQNFRPCYLKRPRECQRDRQGTDDVLDEIERDLAAISQKSKAPNAMDSVLIATAINDIPTDSNETIASNTAAFSSHCVAADHSTIAEFYHDDEADSATSTQFSDNTVIKNCTTGGPIYDSNGFFVDWR